MDQQYETTENSKSEANLLNQPIFKMTNKNTRTTKKMNEKSALNLSQNQS